MARHNVATMNTNTNDGPARDASRMPAGQIMAASIGFGVGIGSAVGVAIGAITHEMGMWVGIGIGTGVAVAASIGAVMASRRQREARGAEPRPLDAPGDDSAL